MNDIGSFDDDDILVGVLVEWALLLCIEEEAGGDDGDCLLCVYDVKVIVINPL